MADERMSNYGAKIASIIDKTKIWFSFYLFLTDKHTSVHIFQSIKFRFLNFRIKSLVNSSAPRAFRCEPS